MPALESGESTEVLSEEIKSLKQSVKRHQKNLIERSAEVSDLETLNKSLSKSVESLEEQLKTERCELKDQQKMMSDEIFKLKNHVKTVTDNLEIMSKKSKSKPKVRYFFCENGP